MIFYRFWYNVEGHIFNKQALFQLFIDTHVHLAPNRQGVLRNPIGILLESQAFKGSKNLYNLYCIALPYARSPRTMNR